MCPDTAAPARMPKGCPRVDDMGYSKLHFATHSIPNCIPRTKIALDRSSSVSMAFERVMVRAKGRRIKMDGVGAMVNADTTPSDFSDNIAMGVPNWVGPFNMTAHVDGIPCPQSATRIVQVCQEAIQAQSHRAIEKAFPGCHLTDKHSKTYLLLHIEAKPEQEPAAEASRALYSGNNGTRGKAQHQVRLPRHLAYCLHCRLLPRCEMP